MAKFPPDPGVLRAIAAGRVGWVTAMSEWIDNAFDRRAQRVNIAFEKGVLFIEDDGEGTPSPQNIVQLGKHTPSDGLGEFGMGGTEALLWAGGELSGIAIKSVHEGITRRLDMKWTQYAQSGWELPDPDEEQAELGEVGTHIVVRPLRARPLRDAQEVCEEIGYYYSHAIRTLAKKITIKPPRRSAIEIAPWRPPEYEIEPRINTQIEVEGKTVRIHAGVVKEGIRNVRMGLTYWYGYRVIIPESAKGCGEFNPTRVCGFVELADPRWKAILTRNKNGLTAGDEELFAAVEFAIRPVLEAADRAGATFAHRDLSARLESRIGEMLSASKDAKAVREHGSKHGTVRQVGTDRTHGRADKEQPGITFPGRKSGGSIRICYEPLGGQKVGEAKPPNVILNLDNTFIAQAVKTNNEDVLLFAVATVIADYDCAHDVQGNRWFKGWEPRSLLDQLGLILATSPTINGRSIVRGVA